MVYGRFENCIVVMMSLGIRTDDFWEKHIPRETVFETGFEDLAVHSRPSGGGSYPPSLSPRAQGLCVICITHIMLHNFKI